MVLGSLAKQFAIVSLISNIVFLSACGDNKTSESNIENQITTPSVEFSFFANSSVDDIPIENCSIEQNDDSCTIKNASLNKTYQTDLQVIQNYYQIAQSVQL
ncbi:hypothetical protein ACLKMH_18405 [Psychromonas sp. KJ10-10]|uniref:hypothetical protein n=1 Tax=Psychromonas sp. KJ10-10 TaxID=3391823 RepID=UPI0039B49A4D